MQMTESISDTEVAKKMPYRIIKDGNGMEHKVINLDDESLLPKTGQIIFEAQKKSTRLPVHGYAYTCTRDILSEVMVGIHVGIHPKSKELVWLRMNLGTINTFDLSIPMERKKAIVLLYSTIVIGSPNLSTNINLHLFRVHDAEKAANLEIKRIEDGQRALSIAKGLYGEDLFNMARNMGIMPETTSLPILTAEVYKVAEKRPLEFLQVWDNPNRDLITILKRCLDTGVINHNSLEGYSYDGRFLGHNEPAVYDYFHKYRDVAGTLDLKSKDKLKQSEKAMAKAAPVTFSTDDKIENAILRKELAEMKAMMAEMSANSIREKTADESNAPKELVLELEKLKLEASKYKMKGLHHFKPTEESIAKLKEKITEAEKESD